MHSDSESELSEPTSELWRDLEQNAKRIEEETDDSGEIPNDPPKSPMDQPQDAIHQTQAVKTPLANGYVDEEILNAKTPEVQPQDVVHQQTEATKPPLANGHADDEAVIGKAPDTKPAKPKGSAKATPAKKPVKSAKARKEDRLWEVDTVVTDRESPLVNITNLQALLMKDEAWTLLSKEQQKKLISLLPNELTVEEDKNCDLPNVLRATLQSSLAMKADIRLFQEDLQAGRLEPEWQLMARTAMKRRADGDFDEFERQSREEIWGEQQDELKENGHDEKVNGKDKSKSNKRQKTKR